MATRRRSSTSRRSIPGGTRALVDCSLDVADGELLVLVGPSGCGKSTLLRLRRGPRGRRPRGTIRIGERVVNDAPAAGAQRRDGVPGLRALSAHDGAREPRVPARACGACARDEVAARVARVAELLELGALLERLPRAALGRPAPARRHGARARARARGLPARRAALEPRRQAARPGARRDRGAAAPHAHDDALRHARPGRGDDARRPRRGAATAGASSRSRRRASSTTGRRTRSSRASSATRR